MDPSESSVLMLERDRSLLASGDGPFISDDMTKPAEPEGTTSGARSCKTATPRPIPIRVVVENMRPGAQSRRHRTVRPPGVWVVLAVMAAGALCVSVGYAFGRGHREQLANLAFWVGQGLMFVPAVLALLRERRTRGDHLIVVAMLGFLQVLVKWCYSPLGFTFGDELLHWRSATTILQHHHLFSQNPVFPIDPFYPGLEIVTTALVQLTHLNLFFAGTVVVLMAHIATVVGMFVMFRRVFRSERLAGAGVAVFVVTPDFGFFGSFFVYETLGLSFAVGVIFLLLRSVTAGAKTDATLSLVLLLALIPTHHVTSLFVLGVLLCLTVGSSLAARSLGHSRSDDAVSARRLAAHGLALFIVGVIAFVAWVELVAPRTISYLGSTISSELAPLLGSARDASSVSLGIQPSPLDRGLSYGAAALLAVMVLVGAIAAVLRPQKPLVRVVAVLGLSYLGVLVIRVLAPSSVQISGRALIFAAFFSSAAAVLALVKPCDTGLRWRIPKAASAFLLTVLMVGGILTGWPPSFERIPGTFHVDGYESGFDGKIRLATRWAGAHISKGSAIACDATLCGEMAAFDGLDPVASSPIIVPTRYRTVRTILQREGVQYIAVDRRMTKQRAAAGTFFEGPGSGSQTILPAGSLGKFARAGTLSRVFDDGEVVIYRNRSVDAAQ